MPPHPTDQHDANGQHDDKKPDELPDRIGLTWLSPPPHEPPPAPSPYLDRMKNGFLGHADIAQIASEARERYQERGRGAVVVIWRGADYERLTVLYEPRHEVIRLLDDGHASPAALDDAWSKMRDYDPARSFVVALLSTDGSSFDILTPRSHQDHQPAER